MKITEHFPAVVLTDAFCRSENQSINNSFGLLIHLIKMLIWIMVKLSGWVSY